MLARAWSLLARRRHAAAGRLLGAGHYRAALAHQHAALGAAERAFGADSPELVAYLVNLGVAGKYTARFDEAESAYRRALALVQAHGADPDAAASLHHNLGGLEHARGNLAAAEAWARASVELRRAAWGPGHPKVAADLAALGAIVHGLGRHDEAEALLRQALGVFEAAYGPDHYEVGMATHNLAACLAERGETDQAEAAYRRALHILEARLGAQHPDLAATLNNLGALRRRRGDYGEAEALYVRALGTMEARLGPSHPSVQTCRDNYTRLLGAIGAAGSPRVPASAGGAGVRSDDTGGVRACLPRPGHARPLRSARRKTAPGRHAVTADPPRPGVGARRERNESGTRG